MKDYSQSHLSECPVASFTKEVNPRLVKHQLVFHGRLANRGLTSLVKSLGPSDAYMRR